ncbi:MAG: hypothetical protein HRF40_02315 [Nitrososphaera sp.]
MEEGQEQDPPGKAIRAKNLAKEKPVLNEKEIQKHLEALLVEYSKLIASGRSYSIKDYFDLTIKSFPIRAILLVFGSLIQNPESAILEYGTSKKKYALERIGMFCDSLIEILEDIERSGHDDFKKLRSLKQMLVDFRKTVPAPPKGITLGQIISSALIVIPSIITILQYFAPSQIEIVNIVFALTPVFGLGLALWIAMWLTLLFKDYIWYRIMVRRLKIRSKEILVLNCIRPLTKNFSKWVYSKDE